MSPADERGTSERPSGAGAAPAGGEPVRIEPQVIAGYGAGVGTVFVATLGVFWNYWRPETSAWIWATASFLIGAAIGAGWAALRRGRV